MHTFSQITWEFILLRWTGEIHACRKIVPISFGTHILYTDPTYVYMLYMMYNYIRYMGSSVFFFCFKYNCDKIISFYSIFDGLGTLGYRF